MIMASAININEIQLFNLLKAKIGEKEAEALIEYVKASASEELKNNIQVLATREFVKDEIKTVRDEINNLRIEIREFKSEIIKWMFLFWTGSILATLGALFALVKIFIK